MNSVRRELRERLLPAPIEPSYDDAVIDGALKDQLFEEIERLSPEQLAQVYQYTHSLAKPALPRGGSIADLRALAGTIDDESARQMKAAIEGAFERVDPSEW